MQGFCQESNGIGQLQNTEIGTGLPEADTLYGNSTQALRKLYAGDAAQTLVSEGWANGVSTGWRRHASDQAAKIWGLGREMTSSG